MPRRRPTLALAVAAGFVAAGALVWLVALHTGPGARLDRAVYAGFVGLRPTAEALGARDFTSIVDPRPFVLWTAMLVLVAVLRRRPATAAAVAAILIGANATTQVLKPALAIPRSSGPAAFPADFPASWPSGHTTAAMSLALCLVLVAPSRLRPTAAAGAGLLVVLIVSSIVALGAHLPSDVLGGFCVAAAWAWLGVAGLWALAPPAAAQAPARPRLAAVLAPPALAALGACVVVAVAVLLHPEGARAYAEDHTTFVAGAAAICVAGLVTVSALPVLLRRA
jgi:membrane-associated phospholipid phosphatase